MFFGTGCAGLAAGAGKAFCWFAPSNGECGTNVVSKLVRLASIASPGNACGCWARVEGMELELGDGVLKSLWVPLSITLGCSCTKLNTYCCQDAKDFHPEPMEIIAGSSSWPYT